MHNIHTYSCTHAARVCSEESACVRIHGFYLFRTVVPFDLLRVISYFHRCDAIIVSLSVCSVKCFPRWRLLFPAVRSPPRPQDSVMRRSDARLSMMNPQEHTRHSHLCPSPAGISGVLSSTITDYCGSMRVS